MKNKAKLFGIYLPVFVVLLTASLVLRTVALFLDFNFDTGYFIEKTLSSISDYITVAACIFFLTYIFTARRDMKLIPDFTSPATYVPTGIVTAALAFVICVLIQKARYIKEYIDVLGGYAPNYKPALEEMALQRRFLIIVVVTAVFAVLSIVHFVLTALIEKNSSTKRAAYGIFTVLFLSIYGLYLYFDPNLPINVPNKILDQMVYLLAAVFFLYETRLSLGREKWRPYIAFGFISSFVGFYSSLPAIIVYFGKGEVLANGVYQTEIVANSIYESVLTFALSAFILSRILLTGELIEDKPSATVASLLQFADARDAVLNPVTATPEIIEISGEELVEAEIAENADDNQITIEDVEIGITENEAEQSEAEVQGPVSEVQEEMPQQPEEKNEIGTETDPEEEQ